MRNKAAKTMLSDSEYDQLMGQAEAAGLPLGAYMRAVLLNEQVRTDTVLIRTSGEDTTELLRAVRTDEVLKNVIESRAYHVARQLVNEYNDSLLSDGGVLSLMKSEIDNLKAQVSELYGS